MLIVIYLGNEYNALKTVKYELLFMFHKSEEKI